MENDVNTSLVTEEESGISFKDLLFIVKKHLLVIIAIIVVLTGLGYAYSKAQKPEYKSNSTVFVAYEGNSSTTIQTQYTFSLYISKTFVAFMSDDVVLDDAAAKLSEQGINVTAKQLKNKLSVKLIEDTLLIDVTYVDYDAKNAQVITNTVIKSAQDIANTVIDGKKEYPMLYDNLKVLSAAKEGTRVSHTMKNMVVFFALGVVVAFLYVLLREVLNNKFKSDEEVERALNMPVLALIPEYSLDDEKKGSN